LTTHARNAFEVIFDSDKAPKCRRCDLAEVEITGTAAHDARRMASNPIPDFW
jgi:hypothetical protein